MDIVTKFSVNDFVYIRAQVKHFKEVLEPLVASLTVPGRDYVSMGDLEIGLKKPMAFQIIERVIQTCPNGTQTHYRIRSLSSDAVLQFLESELSSEFSY